MNKRWIYLSPHLDDAILSCGGLIRKQVLSRISVEVWTIFAGDPPDGSISAFAVEQHNRWNPNNNYSELRRLEDIAACQLLGVRHRHLPFLDCIYRHGIDGRWLYNSESEIFGKVSKDDESTKEVITTFLKTTLKASDIVIIPLAVGNHVDHQIVRMASERMQNPIYHYADIPYLMRHPEDLMESNKNFKNEIHDLPVDCLNSWKDAIRCYSSQVNILFGNDEKMDESISKYYNLNGGFILWKPVASA